ncbi:MAG: TetR/AcrR family transcriptional regulator [Bacteroidota bacterium]
MSNKHKEEVAEAILSAALRLFRTQGVPQTSLRNIATEAGYTPGNVYLYFKNKAALLHTLHARGFVQLGAQFKILRSVQDPLERLKALGKVYLTFALEDPAMYHLMFVSNEPMEHLERDADTLWSEGNETFGELKRTIIACLKAGHFVGHTVEPFSLMVWSTVHGMATLAIGERIDRVRFEQPTDLLDRSYQAFCLMLDQLP